MPSNNPNLPLRQGQTSGGLLAPLFSPESFFAMSPFQLMRRIQEDMDRLFTQAASNGLMPAEAGSPMGLATFAPSVDVSETDQEFRIEVDLPGVQPENIDVQIQQGLLTLRAELRDEQSDNQQNQNQPQASSDSAESSAQSQSELQGQQNSAGQQRRYHTRERRYGYFERTMSLPPNVDENNIRADFNQGVLTLHLPKAQPAQPSVRRIPVGRMGTASGPQVDTVSTSMSTDSATASGESAPPEQQVQTAGASVGGETAQEG